MTRTVGKTLRSIERAQDVRGSGGCFSELHRYLRSAVQRINLLHSFIGDQETHRRLGRISRIAKSLPELHSERVVTRRLRELHELTNHRRGQ